MAALTQSEVRKQTADEALENVAPDFETDSAVHEYAHAAAVEAVRLIQQQTADQLDALSNALYDARNSTQFRGAAKRVREAAQELINATDRALGTFRS